MVRQGASDIVPFSGRPRAADAVRQTGWAQLCGKNGNTCATPQISATDAKIKGMASLRTNASGGPLRRHSEMHHESHDAAIKRERSDQAQGRLLPSGNGAHARTRSNRMKDRRSNTEAGADEMPPSRSSDES